LLLLAVGAVVVSLVYGLLAVLLQAVLASTISLNSLKQVISYTTGGLTALLLPVWLAAFLGYGCHGGGVKAGIAAGLRGLKRSYWKLLCILAIAFLLGLLANWVFRAGGVFFGLGPILKGISLALIGGTATYCSAMACEPKE
ncbi:MAG: hypothetical protein ACK5L3_02040, partial [Oscillospiraceae bacterium]